MTTAHHLRELPAHRARSVLIVLLEGLFDFTPALASSVRRQPGAWSSTAWKVCPSCNGDGSVKRGKHRVSCGRCRSEGGWRIDPYDRRQAVAEAQPVAAMTLPELERACASLDPHLPAFDVAGLQAEPVLREVVDYLGAVVVRRGWIAASAPGADVSMSVFAPSELEARESFARAVAAHPDRRPTVAEISDASDRRDPPEDPDSLLDAIELQLRYRTEAPVYRQVEAALIQMRNVAPYHRGVLVRVHVSQWQSASELSLKDRARYDDAFVILADILGEQFRAPRPVRERALELEVMDDERRDVRAAAGRWGPEGAKKERDRRIRFLVEERGWSARAVARHLRVSDRTVRRALERDEAAA